MKQIPIEDMPANEEKGIEMVCENDRLAYFGTYDFGLFFAEKLYKEKGCELLIFSQPLSVDSFGFIFSRANPYRRMINKRYCKLWTPILTS